MPPEKEQAVLVQQTTQKKESNKKKSKDKKDKLFHTGTKCLHDNVASCERMGRCAERQ